MCPLRLPASDSSLLSLLQLFPSLYELGHILASDGPVRHRLESVATEVSKAVDKELQVTPRESQGCLVFWPAGGRWAGHAKAIFAILVLRLRLLLGGGGYVQG